MGRAIVRDPKAFLMDEPLSNLDAKLRVQMRTEVARLQSELETTTVYVTHDQTEAMTLGDRVAVMRAGVLQQVGHAGRALRQPGEPLRRRLHRLAGDELHAGRDQRRAGEAADRRGRLPRERDVGRRRRRQGDRRAAAGELRGRRGGRRPASRSAAITFEAEIDLVESLGSDLYAYFDAEGGSVEAEELAELAADVGAEGGSGSDTVQLVARIDPASKVRRGEDAELWVDTRRFHFFDPDSGKSLTA